MVKLFKKDVRVRLREFRADVNINFKYVRPFKLVLKSETVEIGCPRLIRECRASMESLLNTCVCLRNSNMLKRFKYGVIVRLGECLVDVSVLT